MSEIRNVSGSRIPPPCPAWCTDVSPEHLNEYDGVVDDGSGAQLKMARAGAPVTGWSRIHSHNLGSAGVVCEEINRGGVVTLERPTVAIYDDAPKDAGAARQVARDIAAAAELLGRITAAATA